MQTGPAHTSPSPRPSPPRRGRGRIIGGPWLHPLPLRGGEGRGEGGLGGTVQKRPTCWQESPRRILIWLLLFKLGYLLAVFLAVRSWPALDSEVFERVHQHWPRQGGPVFATHFATWDTAHYLYLSEVGYSAGVPSCAFYPLWPLLIRAFAVCTGGNHLVSGLILANLFSLAGWWLFYFLVCKRFGARAATFGLLFLLVFPGSLFFQFPYSESLFFLLLMLLWLGLETDCSFVLLGSAFLLPMTRAIGVFCLVPIAWHFLRTPCASLYKSWRKPSQASCPSDRAAAPARFPSSTRESDSQPVHFDAADGLGCLLHFNGCLDGKPLRGNASAALLGCPIHPQHLRSSQVYLFLFFADRVP